MKLKFYKITIVNICLVWMGNLYGQCTNGGSGCNCPVDTSNVVIIDETNFGCGGTITLNYPTNGDIANNTIVTATNMVTNLTYNLNGNGVFGVASTVFTAINVPPGQYCVSMSWTCWPYSICTIVKNIPFQIQAASYTVPTKNITPTAANNSSCNNGIIQITRTDNQCINTVHTILSYVSTPCASGGNITGNITLGGGQSGSITNLRAGTYKVETKYNNVPIDTITTIVPCNDITPPTISYLPQTEGVCFSGAGSWSFEATVSDCGGVPTSGIGLPVFYVKKNNLPWQSYQTTYFSGNTYAFTYSPISNGDTLRYFVVAQDNLGNVGSFPTGASGFGSNPPSASNPTPTPTVFDMPENLVAGEHFVGISGEFSTLTQAVNYYNRGCGANVPITFTLLDNTYPNESFPLNLTRSTNTIVNNLTIKPANNTNVTIIGDNNFAIFQFNGLDYSTIHGNVENGSSLTIRNTNGITGRAIYLINTARFNKIRNVELQGNGEVGVFATSINSNNNSVKGCNIRNIPGASSFPTVLVSGGDTIQNCKLFEFGTTAISTGSVAYIVDNDIYQLTTKTNPLKGISLTGGSMFTKIINNDIGGTDINMGGSFMSLTNTFTGIECYGSTSGTPAIIQGNRISNIRSTFSSGYTSSYGINVLAGAVEIKDNIIGSSDVQKRIEINGDTYGIRTNSSNTCLIQNNTIENMTMTATPPTGTFKFGIGTSGTGNISIINNSISKLTNTSNPDASFDVIMAPIIVQNSGTASIKGNTIFNCGNTGTNIPAVRNFINTGIRCFNISGVIENNKVYDLYSSSPTLGARADYVEGIFLGLSGTTTIQNNMISLDGGTSPSDRFVRGIVDNTNAGTKTYYNNSINIFGNSNGGNKTHAFIKGFDLPVTFKNNLFSNIRTSGSGAHFAIGTVASTNTAWTASSSDYNDLYSSNSAHVGEWWPTPASPNKNFDDWKTATGGDQNSVNIQPIFTSNTDLHLSVVSNPTLDYRGTPIPITNDIDGNVRSIYSPDVGADEFGTECRRIVESTSDSGIATLRDCITCAHPNTSIKFASSIDTVHLIGDLILNKSLKFIDDFSPNVVWKHTAPGHLITNTNTETTMTNIEVLQVGNSPLDVTVENNGNITTYNSKIKSKPQPPHILINEGALFKVMTLTTFMQE